MPDILTKSDVFLLRGKVLRANERKVEGTYYDRITQMCWQAWRKSWARRFTTVVSPTGDA